MPKLFKKAIFLTIFIVLPMVATNVILSYLQHVDLEKELLILIVVGVIVLGIAVGIVIKQVRGKISSQLNHD